MKISIGTIAIIVIAWLGLWVSNTGLLIYSADTGVLKTRDCRYLIGVTVQKRTVPLAGSCPILRSGS